MKYLMFFFNLIFSLLGLGAFIIGLIIKFKKSLITDLTKDLVDESFSNELVAYILIILGVVILLIATCGCCGACKESTCLLLLYSFILIILILAQLACAIFVGIKWNKIENIIEEELENVVKTKVGTGDDDTMLQALNYLQTTFKCCGGTNYKDYENSKYANVSSNNVPYSCCVLSKSVGDDGFDIFKTKETDVKDWTACNSDADFSSTTKTSNTDNLYVGGCLSSFVGMIKSSLFLFIGIVAGIWVFEIFCVVFACCVRSAILD